MKKPNSKIGKYVNSIADVAAPKQLMMKTVKKKEPQGQLMKKTIKKK
jgi:hypothetical protein